MNANGKFVLNSLLLLDEISNSRDLARLDLSNRPGVPLGLVTSYLKALISKGFTAVSAVQGIWRAHNLTSIEVLAHF